MIPRATLEIPGGARRLHRIIELIGNCRYSFRDLSRVEIDAADPPAPRDKICRSNSASPSPGTAFRPTGRSGLFSNP
jgi:hypothetical protein